MAVVVASGCPAIPGGMCAHDCRRGGAVIEYLPLGSASPDANDADVGDLLVDEVGDADRRRQLIIEQLDARHDLAARPRRSVRHQANSSSVRRRDPPA